MACTEKGYWHTPNPKPENLRFSKGPHSGFTGKRGDRYFHKGRRWLGTTDRVGQPGPNGFELIKTDENVFGLMPR